MKNDMYGPLKSAIKKKTVVEEHKFDFPRVMETKVSEIGKKHPGQECEFVVKGSVKSVDDEGRVMVAIRSIKSKEYVQHEKKEESNVLK